MTTSESFRQDVAETLEALLKSSDPRAAASFSNCLSAEERKYVHHIAEQFGLRHDSKGHGDARYITVKRDPDKAGRRGLGSQQETPLRLPPTAWEALEHPLVRHACQNGNVEAVQRSAPLATIGRDEVVQLLGEPLRRKQLEPLPPEEPPKSPLLRTRKGLPAWGARDEVLKATSERQVTMVVGETGCGKSTQVPQFLLEQGAASVLVTQPRRLSALALAHRVAQERGEAVGSVVGYSVHLEHVGSPATRLLFCTVGVFRRRLLADPTLQGVSHVVLDELHERDKVADFLLIALRELLAARPKLRLVLMSATMQYETFRQYFPGCAEVRIPGRAFPVEEMYLEQIAPPLHQLGYTAALGPGFAAGGLGYGTWDDKRYEKSFKYQVLVSHVRDRDGLCGYAGNGSKPLVGPRLEEGLFLHDVLQQTKGVAFDLPIVEGLLSALANHNAPLCQGAVSASGGILVFLPGWDDIDRLKRRLQANPILGNPGRFWVLVLHSQIQLEQQRDVFRTPPQGVRKIILSTNIAETSITVDDVDVVVDCGRSKETSYDSFLRVPTLNTSWVSRAAIAQRAGRAGRTAPGICFHIFSRRRCEMLDAHRPPEMLRTSLHDVCLDARLLLTLQARPEAALTEYFQAAPDPPEERSVRSSEELLQVIGALTNGDTQPQLTALGVHLCNMPLPPQLAKIVVWANILGVGKDVLPIVGSLQYREPFKSIGDALKPMSLAEANKSVRLAKRNLCAPDRSDHLALLAASRGFEETRQRGTDEAQNFCEANSLSFRQMDVLRQTCTKLKKEMKDRGFWSQSVRRNEGDKDLLMAALCAGLFPNIAHRAAKGKMQVNAGSLEAVPHPSSVVSFSARGRDFWEGNADDEAGDRWLCFNELSQVEDHYSLSGLSPVSSSVLLLLCGEGQLAARGVQAGEGAEEDAAAAAAADERSFSKWWAAPGEAGAVTSGRPCESDVVLSIPELGDWFALRLSSEMASRVQALRAMLQMLFRVYCCDPLRWHDVVAEGQPGALVLDLAASVLRSAPKEASAGAETGPDKRRSAAAAGPRQASPAEPERPSRKAQTNKASLAETERSTRKAEVNKAGVAETERSTRKAEVSKASLAETERSTRKAEVSKANHTESERPVRKAEADKASPSEPERPLPKRENGKAHNKMHTKPQAEDEAKAQPRKPRSVTDGSKPQKNGASPKEWLQEERIPHRGMYSESTWPESESSEPLSTQPTRCSHAPPTAEPTHAASYYPAAAAKASSSASKAPASVAPAVAPPRSAAPPAIHQQNRGECAGHAPKFCAGCDRRLDEGSGCWNTNDWNWYCWGCWDLFYAAQRQQEQAFW